MELLCIQVSAEKFSIQFAPQILICNQLVKFREMSSTKKLSVPILYARTFIYITAKCMFKDYLLK